MQVRFIRMIDKRLENAPHSRKTMELKEEIVQNLMEKYNDLRSEGKSEEDAFNIAAESIGDLSALVKDLRKDEPFYDEALDGAPEYTAGAEDVDDEPPAYVPRRMETFAEPSPEQARHRSAMIIATAVMLFVLSPVPYLFFGARMGTLLLFAMIASGIGLLVFNSLSRPASAPAAADATPESPEAAPKGNDLRDVPIEDRPRRKKEKTQKGLIESSFWLLAVAVYILISFETRGWHLTWVIFLFAAAAADLVKLMLDPNPKKLLGRISGVLWTATTGFYFILSFGTRAWHISWIIFLIAAALNNMLRVFLNPKGSR